MAKASPARNSFNAGEFSVLVEARTDLDRYPASMRRMFNYICTPQGPAVGRSGTVFVAAVYDETKLSTLVPFVFSEDQALQLEFAEGRIRFITDDGPQVYTPVAVTAVAAGASVQITSAALAANIGDEVFLAGFPVAANVNNRVGRITNKVGNVYTLNVLYPVGMPAIVAPTAARLYHIDNSYLAADLVNLRTLQSVDVVRLYCEGYRNFKLSRYGAYDWRLSEVIYKDGPYLPIDATGTRMAISATGNPIPNMTSNTAPSGVVSSAFGSTGNPFQAFDNNQNTSWSSGFGQTADNWIRYQFPAPIVVDGYVIYVSKNNNGDGTYSAKDYAPGSFTFEGSQDGATWTVLDAEDGYVLYDNLRSVWFKLNNTTAYLYYRLRISQCTRNGNIAPSISRIIMSSPSANAGITITASAVTGINNDTGFKTTDVGRMIRLKGNDATWRPFRITAWVSATQVVATLEGEPFNSLDPIINWRLGYWSDTTGWPGAVEFFDDRLWLCGTTQYPDLVCASRTGAYDDIQQSTTVDEVLDDSAIVFRLNARKLSRIRWVRADERGLLLGTGSGEHVVTPSNADAAITARNIKARPSTRRGSANIDPIQVDRQVLFTQTSQRTVREMAFVFEADGYKTPSMSLFASHLGNPKLVEMDYAAEPHSIIWMRRDDGTVVGLTYNRDENVIGWHQHDFGGVVESCSVIPNVASLQDALWLIVRRVINGQTRRFIERMRPFWDFNTTLLNSHFVDCGVRYSGVATDTITGLWWLEGEEVQGLADGVPFISTVVNGAVMVNAEAVRIHAGKFFTGECEISRIEAGAADGTAQGKAKRPNLVVPSLWSSLGGEIGRYNEDTKVVEYTPIDYTGSEDFDAIGPPNLFTGMLGAIPLPLGYGERGSLYFKRTEPLPLNIIALYPQINTQDR